MNPHLPEPLFKLGTTSFIFPDHILPNVLKLGKRFDEIELLLFESAPTEVLPTRNEIKQLAQLSRALDITYNIHLPIDISLTHPHALLRNQGIDRIKTVMDLCTGLNPSSFTLHLDYSEDNHLPDTVSAWKDRVFQSTKQLIASGMAPKKISVETLNYPFAYLDDIIESQELSVCLDIGHVIKYGFDLEKLFQQHHARIEIIHLHGVDFSIAGGKDHTALDRLSESHLQTIMSILGRFDKVVSLEVFNKTHLDSSLETLGRFFNKIPLPEKSSGPAQGA